MGAPNFILAPGAI